MCSTALCYILEWNIHITHMKPWIGHAKVQIRLINDMVAGYLVKMGANMLKSMDNIDDVTGCSTW